MTRDLVQIGKALAAPARVAMINMLFDGAEHTAGELARGARVSAATGSEHLTVLTAAGIVVSHTAGRRRYYRLADEDIAHALEQLSQSYPEPEITSLRLSREQQRVRAARTCYDHLAGQLGVGVTARFIELGWIDRAVSAVTDLGLRELPQRLAIDLVAGTTKRPMLRSCTDWTEKRPHMAGTLGAAVTTSFLERGWVTRKPSSRALVITALGLSELDAFGITVLAS